MTKTSATDFFTEELAQAYDERNRKLAPIAEGMHYLIQLVLSELPLRAQILCVGVGTGAEILSLSKTFPEWSFVGVDPSQSMLEVCRARLKEAGLLDRCTLVHGYVEDISLGEFDAVLSVLVAHFLKREKRQSFFHEMVSRLKQGGYLINAELSFDLDSVQFPLMLKNWEKIQTLMGATQESLIKLPQQLRDTLTILSNDETEALLRASGIKNPMQFFQAFMISGWCGVK